MATKPNDKTLSAAELKLVHMLVDPEDTRSKEDKSIAAGFAPKTVYDKEKQPHVAKAIDEGLAALKRRFRFAEAQVVQAVIGRATDSSRSDCTENSKLFFQYIGAVGTGGVNINQRIEQNGSTNDSLERRIQLDERERVVSEN